MVSGIVIGVTVCLLFGVSANAQQAAQQTSDPFAAIVRTTEPLTPQQEGRTFRLPPGFSIQLFASEPQIAKPMNLAFDSRGRLWVTSSTEYPMAAPSSRTGRDKIQVLEDTDGDGHADVVQTFADGLNIPIGLYPYGQGVICFSIPHIWHLEDTDADGRADRRSRLYGPMGFQRDTHGMNNSFRRGFDGWLYACHGFNNETTVAGRDGHRITMQSGNTYRMRLDGSRVEHFTWGQVNPFGMAQDELGNLFTADCHSKPIYQLLRGGYYPSFGKPHDGLGFVRPMMNHLHGSTAIAGVAHYSGTQFPAEYRGNLFSGNVMTSRVNRNRLEMVGATVVAHELPDFLTTTDPWFRPCDVRMGPDGALYVADFYNRIIGHYEVPLDHPGRDRRRGRIWRIAYTGNAPHGDTGDSADPKRKSVADTTDTVAKSQPASVDGTRSPRLARKMPNLQQLDTGQLVRVLRDPNLTLRMLAVDRLTDDILSSVSNASRNAPLRKDPASGEHARVRKILTETIESLAVKLSDQPYLGKDALADARQAVHIMWILHRMDGLPEGIRARMAGSSQPLARLHVMKIYSESKRWSGTDRKAVIDGLADGDAFVRRAAADALAQQAQRTSHAIAGSSNTAQKTAERVAMGADAGRALLAALSLVSAKDHQLTQGLRIALRDWLRVDGVLTAMDRPQLSAVDAAAVADICLAVGSPESARFVLRFLQDADVARPRFVALLRHAARHADAESTREIAHLAQKRFAKDLSFQLELLEAVSEGLAQRGGRVSPAVATWASQAAANLWEIIDQRGESLWRNYPIEGMVAASPPAVPWTSQVRRSADGNTTARFFSSLPRGEQGTGRLVSPPFRVPAKLSFYLAGHDGHPPKPIRGRNKVVLRLLAKQPDGAEGPIKSASRSAPVIAEAAAPRNDVAQLVQWELRQHAGRLAQLEIIDADAGSAYAWLAVGRFEPAVISVTSTDIDSLDQQITGLANLVEGWKLAQYLPQMKRLLGDDKLSWSVRKDVGSALTALSGQWESASLLHVLDQTGLPLTARQQAIRRIGGDMEVAVAPLLEAALKTATATRQRQLAESLASHREGADLLLKLIASGKASPRLLRNPNVQVRLAALKNASLDQRATGLLKNLPAGDAALQQLIRYRAEKFDRVRSKHSVEKGAQIFKKNCATCHKLRDEGKVVGPQLDGIQKRGTERVIEDILDPNRNVDVAFRQLQIRTNGGKVLSGLKLRDEGQTLVMADAQGKEFRVPKSEIDESTESSVSLMPENVVRDMPEQVLFDLLAFLLQDRG